MVVVGTEGTPWWWWRGVPAGVHPRALGSACAKCRAPLSTRAVIQSVRPLGWRLPLPPPTPLLAAPTLPHQGRGRRPPIPKQTDAPRCFFWTKKAVGRGEEGKCPGADGRLLYPSPPTCRLLPSPLRGGILSQTLGELPLETRHLE